jgi:hypothetical protein
MAPIERLAKYGELVVKTSKSRVCPVSSTVNLISAQRRRRRLVGYMGARPLMNFGGTSHSDEWPLACIWFGGIGEPARVSVGGSGSAACI